MDMVQREDMEEVVSWAHFPGVDEAVGLGEEGAVGRHNTLGEVGSTGGIDYQCTPLGGGPVIVLKLDGDVLRFAVAGRELGELEELGNVVV
jgi:hypothetical protein